MSSRTMIAAIVAATMSVAIAACSSTDDKKPSMKVTQAWARVSAPGQMTSAIYFTINSTNHDQLTGVSVPASVAGTAELHETTAESMAASGTMTTGKMTMHPVPRIGVQPGKPLQLRPGSFHVMLMDLKQPVKAGQTIPVTLHFRTFGEVKVEAEARG